LYKRLGFTKAEKILRLYCISLRGSHSEERDAQEHTDKQ